MNSRPMALITPAKSHPEVIVYSVAARDKKKATAFAKKHGIPHVKDNYQGKWSGNLGGWGLNHPAFLLTMFGSTYR